MSSQYEGKLRLPRLQHASLPIRAGEQAKVREFYSQLLELQEKPAPPGLKERGIIWFAVGDGEMELHFVPDTYLANAQEARHICLEVADLDAYRHRLEQAGYPITYDMSIAHRPRFFSHDPFENRLEFTTIEGDYLA